MSIIDILQSIGIVVVIVGGIITGIVTARRAGKDRDKLDVDTGNVAINSTADALAISRDAAKQVKEMREELSASNRKHEIEIEGLKMEIEELRFEAQEKDAVIESLKDWAERLVLQVKSLDGTPVKMKPVRVVVRQ